MRVLWLAIWRLSKAGFLNNWLLVNGVGGDWFSDFKVEGSEQNNYIYDYNNRTASGGDIRGHEANSDHEPPLAYLPHGSSSLCYYAPSKCSAYTNTIQLIRNNKSDSIDRIGSRTVSHKIPSDNVFISIGKSGKYEKIRDAKNEQVGSQLPRELNEDPLSSTGLDILNFVCKNCPRSFDTINARLLMIVVVDFAHAPRALTYKDMYLNIWVNGTACNYFDNISSEDDTVNRDWIYQNRLIKVERDIGANIYSPVKRKIVVHVEFPYADLICAEAYLNGHNSGLGLTYLGRPYLFLARVTDKVLYHPYDVGEGGDSAFFSYRQMGTPFPKSQDFQEIQSNDYDLVLKPSSSTTTSTSTTATSLTATLYRSIVRKWW